MRHQRLCYAVCKQIAQADIDNKTWERFHRCFFAPEGKHSIQQVAENTSEKVIGCGGYPVAEVEHIIKHKHDTGSKQGVCYTNQNEFPEGLVKNFTERLFHTLYLHRYPR